MHRWAAALLPTIMLAATGLIAAPQNADFVLLHGKIYTENADRKITQAIVVAGGRIIYVGSDSAARRYIGPGTKTEDAGGRLVLPGLIDSHIHPTGGLYPLDICDLKSQVLTLEQITTHLKGCMARYHIRPGQWLTVAQWNFSNGNATDPRHPTLRSALDLVSTSSPIQLVGNDFHHGAYNGAALAQALDDRGRIIGYSAATLKGVFAPMAKLIGVGSNGEPNGTVNEDARDRMAAPGQDSLALAAILKEPEKTMAVLNRDGITAVQDAAVEPGVTTQFYDLLDQRRHLTVRVNLTQLYEPEDYRKPDGTIDYDGIVERAKMLRARYAGNPLIKSDAVKIFADGVLEGNPRADPPTLPDSPVIRPFLQPIFGHSTGGSITVTGYVDTGSLDCQMVQAHQADYASADAVAKFKAAHGYHPLQCMISSGKPQHARPVFMEYLKRMHLAGFTLHIHAIGDEAVRTAVDGIEAARAADGNDGRPDTIAHLQLIAPEDVQRIGKDHIFTVYTFGWIYTDPDYDLTVIPFIDRVKDASFAGLHDAASYYEKQAYPARSTTDAGAILTAGSDAPVDDRDPRPWTNMAMGITRRLPGAPPLGPQERLSVRDVIDAYTINGARALGRQNEIGSIEPGKSADFIIVDRDILALANAGKAEQISDTKVLGTWFRGEKIWSARQQRR